MKISKTGFPFSQPLKRPEHLPPRESERKEKGKKKKEDSRLDHHIHNINENNIGAGGIGRQRAPSLPRKQIKKGIQNKVKKGIQNKVKNGTQNK